MPVHSIVRDSFLGELVRLVSGRRLLRHPEEEPDFVLPEKYAPRIDRLNGIRLSTQISSSTLDVRPWQDGFASQYSLSQSTINAPGHGRSVIALATPEDAEKGKANTELKPSPDATADGTIIVDWYGSDDPECPRNWSFAKRCFVTCNVCLLTFSIYLGSAIYAPGIELVAEQFHVSNVAATIALTLFILGYGIGPMFLSPLSEIPQLGRTSVYILSLFIFVVLQVPTALSNNLGALLPLRFLAGFIGSPPLATGGASIADMWAAEIRAIPIGFWGLTAVSAPVLGPLIGGFVVQAEGWRWTIWILLALSGGSLVYLLMFLPETSAQTILYRRAVRLRRLTGNPNLKSQGEIDSEHMTVGEVAQMTLVRPFVLGIREPMVVAWNLYIALTYGILYIFIESFNVVFIGNHGFTLGQNGLAFLGLFVGTVIAYAFFCPYAYYILKPMFKNGEENFIPENRLPIAMISGVILPISLFWFGWTSSASIHWIVPVIASAFFAIALFLLFQAGLNYLSDCYPRHVASILAGNDFFRSSVGAAFPLVSTAFFRNLGVGPACSVLGGIAVLMMPLPFVLYFYGAKLRSWSRYAD